MGRNGWTRLLIFTCLCTVLAAGCRRLGHTGVAGIDNERLDFEVLDGDHPILGERFDEGERIPDSPLRQVMFAYDSYQIAASEIPKIDEAAAYLRQNPGLRLVAEGHCDERGSREYNMSLGEYRALAVRAHLIGLGIEDARLQTRSYGEESPVDPGHTESAWRLNRRVELQLYR